MKRLAAAACAVALVCCLAGASAAQIGSGKSRTILGITPDPGSLFDIWQVSNAMALDTVSVPLYLNTSASITYAQCRVTWGTDSLTFIGADRGPAVPDTASFIVDSLASDIVEISISNAAPFSIESGSPIAYLKYEVQCFGWGFYTHPRFVSEDSYNFYIAGGLPYAPSRSAGSVRTVSEIMSCLVGTRVDAYAGSQNVESTWDLYQEIAAKLRTVKIVFETSVLAFDTVLAGPGLNGGTVSATVSGDTILLDFPESNPIMPTDESMAFTLRFDLITEDDDYTTIQNLVYAERVDVCGHVDHPPSFYDARILVPAHTASADLGDVSCYTTATTYDLPFALDSSYPVNDYRFFVRFPYDSLTFVGVVAVGGFAAPTAGYLSSDSNQVQIVADPSTNYDPAYLPATVFKLRFQRRWAPPAGTVFHFRFADSPLDHVSYKMDDPFEYRQADITSLVKGSVTIVYPPPPQPSCPTLYVWNGTSFERDNTILAASDGVESAPQATDYYLVTKEPALDNGRIRFQIKEDGRQVSTFSAWKVLAVDHPNDEPIRVARDGRIVTLGQPYAIAWARDHEGRDITNLIAARDEVAYQSNVSGWFEVSFGKMAPEQITLLTSGTEPKPKEEPRVGPRENVGGELKKLAVSIRTADGSYRLIGVEDARLEPGTQATLIDPALVDPGRELVLRYEWEGSYRLDHLEFNVAVPFDGPVSEPRLVRSSYERGPAAGSEIGGVGRALPVTLSPGETIELCFDLSALPPVDPKTTRSYIFVATGAYETPGEASETPIAVGLESIAPNPFNPTTTIRYSLATDSFVEIAVYDVQGRLVRTLVSARQGAGFKTIAWDGRTEAGTPAASGVYFCRMSVAGIVQTRKMILLR